MNTGKEYKLERMLLKDESLLKGSSISGRDLSTVRARQDFIRAWQDLYAKDSLLLTRASRVPLVLFLQSSGSDLGGWRLLVHSSRKTKRISMSLAGLIDAVFTARPLLYDLEICFTRSSLWDFSESKLYLDKLRINKSEDPDGEKFYVKRSAFYANLSSFFWDKVLILIKCDRNGEKIVSLDFLREGDTIEAGEKFYYLVDAGLVNKEARLSFKNREKVQNPEKAILAKAVCELCEYLAGEREEFTLPYAAESGTKFQKMVWQAIATIPYGSTRSYLDIAESIYPSEKAAAYTRAVGHACSLNPLPILLPCHRVIGEQGNLLGFSGGLDIKSKLLNLELFNN